MKIFLKMGTKNQAELTTFLSNINIPKLSEDKLKHCEEDFKKKRFIRFSEMHAKWQISR